LQVLQRLPEREAKKVLGELRKRVSPPKAASIESEMIGGSNAN
jgi:hypothetical protein